MQGDLASLRAEKDADAAEYERRLQVRDRGAMHAAGARTAAWGPFAAGFWQCALQAALTLQHRAHAASRRAPQPEQA